MPDVPIFTIHDSIACPASASGPVAQIMKEEISEMIGIVPNLQFEEWDPKNLGLGGAMVA